MKVLHDHQAIAMESLRGALRAGYKRPLLQAPTGYGKTVLASAIVRSALEKGKRIVFTVPALELVDQTVRAFAAEGITDIGVMQAQHHMTKAEAPVQIASVQTLARRVIPKADLVLVDEAHRDFKLFHDWMADDDWLGVPFIGLSATPWTRGLGRLYDTLIVSATTKDLIAKGFLSPFRVFAPSHPDLSGVRTVAGDYHEGDLSKAMDKRELVANVVTTWLAKAEGRPTLVFAVDRAHAKSLQESFVAAGINAGYVDALTEVADRRALAREFREGRMPVICNVGVLTTGVDWDVRCIVLARPTKSEILYVQILGRGLRTAPGKDCIAEGSLVLTDRGLVPIERVTTAMRVWDGVSWVRHAGAVCRGEQTVIGYGGITATPDHKVWTEHGWTELREAAHRRLRLAQTERDGKAIRLSANHLSGDALEPNAVRVKGSIRTDRVRDVWALSVDQLLEHCARALGWLSGLQPAFARAEVVALAHGAGSGPLHEYEQRQIPRLRGARNRLPFSVGDRWGNVDQGESWLGPKPGDRSHQQRRSLRGGQSETVHANAEHGSYAQDASITAPPCLPAALPRGALCGLHATSEDRRGLDGRADISSVASTVLQAKRQVWDLLNAGPLHRFTVSGRLVHNCLLVLDHSDSTLRLGFVTDVHHERLSEGKLGDAYEAKPKEALPHECKRCAFVIPLRSKACPNCGAEQQMRQTDVVHREGELVELGEHRQGKEAGKRNLGDDWITKISFIGQVRAYSRERNKSEGWVAHTYKKRYGVWPNDERVRYAPAARECGMEVRSWITAMNMRFAKAQEKLRKQRFGAL